MFSLVSLFSLSGGLLRAGYSANINFVRVMDHRASNSNVIDHVTAIGLTVQHNQITLQLDCETNISSLQ